VVVGHLQFDKVAVAEMVLSAEDDEDMLWFSSDLAFWWPSSGNDGTMMLVSLGLREGVNVLEISSVIGPLNESNSVLSLSVDVHIASPELPESIILEDIDVCVDEEAAQVKVPKVDITDKAMIRALTSSRGLLAIVVVKAETRVPAAVTTDASQSLMGFRMGRNAHQPCMPVMTSNTNESTASCLNALALAPLSRPPPHRLVH
jgi:hypothetical protein